MDISGRGTDQAGVFRRPCRSAGGLRGIGQQSLVAIHRGQDDGRGGFRTCDLSRVKRFDIGTAQALDRGVLVISAGASWTRGCPATSAGCPRMWAQIAICAQSQPGAALDILPGVSEKNVEIVRGMLQRVGRRRHGCDARTVCRRPRRPAGWSRWLTPATWHGVDGALEVAAEWMETFDAVRR